MTKPWHQDWLAWFVVVTFVLGIGGTANLACDIGRPFGGYLDEAVVFWDNRLQVNGSTPPWWPNVARLDLEGHALLKINGQPYRPNPDQAFAAAYRQGQTVVTLTIHRSGREVEEEVPIVLFTLSDYLDVKLPYIIPGLSLWLLAVVVYKTRPEDRLNRVATWEFCLAASVFWLSFPSLFYGVGRLTRVLELLLITFMWPFTIAALAHFAFVFPRPGRLSSRFVVYGLYVWAGILGLTGGGSRLLIWLFGWSPLAGKLDELYFTWGTKYFLIACLLILVVRLVWSWLWSGAVPVLRRQLAVVFIGFAFASPFLIAFLLDQWGKQVTFYPTGLDLRYLLLSIPLAFAFVILRYRTFRAANHLFLAVAILAGSALLASLGAWGLEQIQGQTAQPLSRSFVPFLMVALAASTFWGTQASWQGLFSRLLHWERRSYASARKFGQRLVGQTDWAALPIHIARALVEEMKVEQAAIWLWNREATTFALAAQSGRWTTPPSESLIPSSSAEPEAAMRLYQPLRVGPDSPTPPAWLASVHASGAEVIAPLLVLDEWIGLLALGKQWDEEVFDERDLEIIELIAQQASLFLLTARQIDELRQVPGRLAAVQKHERFRIAQDLHDTVQQQLGGLQPVLEACRHYIWTDPHKTTSLLERCTLEVENAAQTLSRIRDDLAPPELARSLEAALRALVERFRQHNSVSVQLSLSPNLDACLPPHAHHELYLVVQQALDNIAEHAQASLVQISLQQTDDRLCFTITDDGRGFSQEPLTMARKGGGFGLLSMQARMSGLGGELEIESSLGAGARLIGWLPMECSPERRVSR